MAETVDEKGRPILNVEIDYQETRLRIDIRVVNNYNMDYWEVYFKGQVPDILRNEKIIDNNIVILWSLDADIEGLKAKQLFSKIMEMFAEEKRFLEVFRYCKNSSRV